MTVLKIIANLDVPDPKIIADFYQRIFGLQSVMDFKWIITSAAETTAPVQLSFASEGGSGTAVPGLSIEVDDLNEVLAKVKDSGTAIEYGPVDEPWGVRRFFICDPANTLINVLCHGK